jgi:hypothetical protein
VAIRSHRVFCQERAEDAQDHDLKNYTRNHKVCADVLQAGTWFGCRSDATASALESQAKYIAGDEDACVPNGRQARPRLPKSNDDVLECKVDTRGDEGGRHDKTADLYLEGGIVIGIVMHHDATNISEKFAQASKSEGNLFR